MPTQKVVFTGREPLEKTVEFMKLLHKTDISPKWEEFDILDCSKSWARQKDKEMTFEELIKYPASSNNLFYDREEWDRDTGEKLNVISFMMRGVNIPSDPRPERFYWWICPYNDENFNVVSDLFKEAYGKNIEDCTSS